MAVEREVGRPSLIDSLDRVQGKGVGLDAAVSNVGRKKQVRAEPNAAAKRRGGAMETRSSDEEHLKQERDRLKLVFENIGNPIVVCDGSTRVVMMNAQAKRLLKPENDAWGNTVHLKNQAQFNTFISLFTDSDQNRTSAPFVLLDTKTHGEVGYHGSSRKVLDEKGKLQYTVTVLQNLTQVERSEQLKLERRMLQIEKFAATGRLAATIAHEINNPMEAVKNAVYLIGKTIPPENESVYSILKLETDRISQIIRHMLGFYRATHKPESVSVNRIIEDAVRLFSREFHSAGIQLETDLGQLPEVISSPDQLLQVFSNLIMNARDSMESGGRLLIRTRLSKGRSETMVVRVVFSDSGDGIPKEIAPRLFEPFVTSKGERGTGLGLWISKGIIESHGGAIRARSRAGRGTLFQILLPVRR